MARALGRDAVTELAGEPDDGGHVLGRLGEDDGGGSLVGGEVPRLSRLVPADMRPARLSWCGWLYDSRPRSPRTSASGPR